MLVTARQQVIRSSVALSVALVAEPEGSLNEEQRRSRKVIGPRLDRTVE